MKVKRLSRTIIRGAFLALLTGCCTAGISCDRSDNRGSTKAPSTSIETRDGADTSVLPVAEESAEPSSNEHDESAETLLSRALERFETESTEKLSKKPCGSDELAKCFELEAKEAWAQAAMCFESTSSWIDLSNPRQRCDKYQFLKAAANFERAEMKQLATERRMKAYQILSHTGGSTDILILLIDRADFLVSKGHVDPAREIYALFLSVGAKNQPEALIEHVKDACKKTGGICDLNEEVTDEERDKLFER